VKTPADRFRDEAIAKALDDAIAGGATARAPLYDKLRRGSGLPGPRFNTSLLRAFVGEVVQRGAAADALLAAMRAFHDDIAPHGHVDEFLAMCGIAGTGARAAADPKARKKMMEPLVEAARDPRSRIRLEVTAAMIAIGLAVGPSIADTLRTWVEDDDAYLTQAALEVISNVEILPMLGAERAAELLDGVYARVAEQSRSGRRAEGFNRLTRALAVAPGTMIARFPQLADVVEKHAKNKDEDVRAVVGELVSVIKKGRAHDRAAAIEAALAASKKPSRDPRWDRLPGKRGRGR
jgi:hypothetical protein